MKYLISHAWGFFPGGMFYKRVCAAKHAVIAPDILDIDIRLTKRPYNPETPSEAWILDNYDIDSLEFRSDAEVVRIAEDEISKGRLEGYQIVDIPDEYVGHIHIENYDGNEWIAQDHLTWGRSHEFGNDR